MSLIVGMSGASGSIYGIRILTLLAEAGIPTHLVMSRSAALTLRLETDYTPEAVQALATEVHPIGDMGAAISSGSFRTDGMIVAPCSMKTLSGIVNSFEENLLIRAAGVTLKESRRLVLMVRETPLHRGQVRLLAEATELGATIFPPVPAFYNRPATIDDIVDQSCARALDQFGYELDIPRWRGAKAAMEGR